MLLPCSVKLPINAVQMHPNLSPLPQPYQCPHVSLVLPCPSPCPIRSPLLPPNFLSSTHPPHTLRPLSCKHTPRPVPSLTPLLFPTTLPAPQARPLVPECLAVPLSLGTSSRRILFPRGRAEAQVGIGGHWRTGARGHAEDNDAHRIDVGATVCDAVCHVGLVGFE
jgi:hypothetical protein